MSDGGSTWPFVLNAHGRRIYLVEHDSRGEALRASGGDFNPDSLRLWKSVVAMRPWDVLVDVGANYGEMLLGLPDPSAHELIAFEPNPTVRERLGRSLGEAGLSVDLRSKAVGARSGAAVDFVLDDTWSGVSGLRETHRSSLSDDVRSVAVEVSTLTDELADLSPDASVCIKVDVEGAEHDVLEGAAQLLREHTHWSLMVEVLHMTEREVMDLVADRRAAMLDKRSGALVGLPRVTDEALRNWINAAWLYRQDLVLMSDAVALERLGGLHG